MNRLEFLEAKVLALSFRLAALEGLSQRRLAGGRDELAAQIVAAALGFAPEVLDVPKSVAQHGCLARALAQQGWSAERIARALRCSEKTVRRCLSLSGQARGKH